MLRELKLIIEEYNRMTGDNYCLVNNLGRPKGTVSDKSKLDGKRDIIAKYLELKVSKASIARTLNCHPQTLSNYISRNMA